MSAPHDSIIWTRELQFDPSMPLLQITFNRHDDGCWTSDTCSTLPAGISVMLILSLLISTMRGHDFPEGVILHVLDHMLDALLSSTDPTFLPNPHCDSCHA